MKKHCLAVSLIWPLVASALLLEIQGSSNSGATDGATDSLKSSKLHFGYQSNGIYPGGFVHPASGYYPGGGVYYPAGAGGAYPAAAGGYPTHPETGSSPPGPGPGPGPEVEDEVEDGGKIPGGVAVDDEVEVFDVPQSNQGGHPSRGYPNGGYPGRGYPSGGYPGVYPNAGYPGYYPGVYVG